MADTEELNIERFDGVIQSFGDAVVPAGATRYSYGFIDDEGHLLRIGGKMCLPDSSKHLTQVIDICQLDFEDDDYLLVHHSSCRELFEPADLNLVATSVSGILEYGMPDVMSEL